MILYFVSIVLIVLNSRVSGDLTREQKRRCEQFMSLYENGKFELQYDYVENIHDKRGYTSGRSAFTTSSGDAFEVVRRYTVLSRNNSLTSYMSELKLLSDRQSPDISNLSGYPDAWRQAANVSQFRQIQIDVSDNLYYRPAMILADRENVRTGLGQCIFYDTVVQNGNGDDLDSTNHIIRETEAQMKGLVDANETEWLQSFLTMRARTLQRPHDPKNALKWREQTERVHVLRQLVEMNNWELKGPIHIDTPFHLVTIP